MKAIFAAGKSESPNPCCWTQNRKLKIDQKMAFMQKYSKSKAVRSIEKNTNKNLLPESNQLFSP